MSVLEASLEAGIYIPSLCYHPSVGVGGSCGLCIVEIDGYEGHPKACLTPVEEGMIIRTDTPEITLIRQKTLELILSKHPYSCLICPNRGTPKCNTFHLVHLHGAKPCLLCRKNGYCELQKVTEYVGIKKISVRSPLRDCLPSVEGFIERDPRLCITCGRCVRVCQDVCGVGAIDFILSDGEVSEVRPINGSLKDSGCRFCGACIEVCPTAALMDANVAPSNTKGLVPCSEDCPVGVAVPRLVSMIAQRRFGDAAALLRRCAALAGILVRVCSNPCEVNCRRGEINEAIAIRALARFALEVGGDDWQPQRKPATGRKVAIVGSGPCGLACGYYLALMGHQVTIFEASPEPGGMMRLGIPDFTLPTQVFKKEIELIEKAGVEIRTCAEVKSLDELFMQGYDAIFVATGICIKTETGIERQAISEKLEDVVSLLTRGLRGNAGGSVAMSAARVALLGMSRGTLAAARSILRWMTPEVCAPEVCIIYQGTDADMPVAPTNLKQGLEEGVKVEFSTQAVNIRKEGEKYVLTCVRTKLGKKRDKDRRRIPEPVEGSEFDMPVEYIVLGDSEKLEVPESFGLALVNGGLFETDVETMMTSREGVFAGGAGVKGQCSVLGSVSAGKKAAISIDSYLGGEGIKDTDSFEEPDLWLGKKVGFAYQERVRVVSTPPEERVKSMQEAEKVLGEEDAVSEACRCLRCHLRLHLRSGLFCCSQSSNSIAHR